MIALVALLLACGTLIMWKATAGGGRREMGEGTVTIPAAGTVVEETGPVAGGPQPATTLPATTQPAITVPPTTVPPTTVAPTTVPPTTVPPTSVAPTTVATTVAPPTTAVTLTGRCASSTYGWDVGVADGWFAADDSTGLWACAAFDRAPVVIRDASEVNLPITITLMEVPMGSVLAGYEEGIYTEVLTEADVPVDIYTARRIEVRATGAGMIPADTLGVAYLVNRGEWSTVLIEGWGDPGVGYEQVKPVVDAMAGDIKFWDS